MVRTLGTKLRLLHGKVRRISQVNFRPDYVADQTARRQGQCRQCGACCELVFRCPFLTSDRRCRIYGLARPASCELFPISEKDLADVQGRCGFRFADPPAVKGPVPVRRPGVVRHARLHSLMLILVIASLWHLMAGPVVAGMVVLVIGLLLTA